jgi:hypothetical protein
MENHLQTILRRKMLLLTTVGLVGCDWLHAGASSGTSPDDEDKRLERKFRGLKGGELRVDALFEANGLTTQDACFLAALCYPPGATPSGHTAPSLVCQRHCVSSGEIDIKLHLILQCHLHLVM